GEAGGSGTAGRDARGRGGGAGAGAHASRPHDAGPDVMGRGHRPHAGDPGGAGGRTAPQGRGATRPNARCQYRPPPTYEPLL
ncbi:MAG: hypothetical protein AVDCRST_MAG88-1347, partial [uncultured Thermomicrobiales bacterium]